MTAGVTYQLEYMLNGGGWTTIGSGLGSNAYNNWSGHQSPALVGRTVQFRVRSYDGTYYSGYTFSSTFDIVDNTPPVANNDTFLRFYTDNQISYTFNAPGVLANDTDVDGDAITVGSPRPNSNVSHGTLTLNANGSFTYTPTNGYKDLNDSFTYYAYDGQENSNSTGTVTIQILTPRFTNASGDGDFNNPANWNCGYVPNESLNLIIASGQMLEINQNYTCKNLKLESGASFICTGGHTLTITGNVLRNDNSVAIQVASSLVVSSSLQIQNR
jgi:VCBS repeat-containing protein